MPAANEYRPGGRVRVRDLATGEEYEAEYRSVVGKVSMGQAAWVEDEPEPEKPSKKASGRRAPKATAGDAPVADPTLSGPAADGGQEAESAENEPTPDLL